MAMGPLSQEQLRLGRIGYLNVLPIYYPLESGIVSHNFEIVSGTPSFLNGLMARGDLDLSVVSSIEYARHPERYFILPDLSISCRGAVKSVLLLSRNPIDQLDGETILVSSQSHTSVALLKILLSLFLGKKAVFEPASCTEALERGKQPVAFLAIGDEALRLRHHPEYPYQWDLGQVWREWTGLPFVFALWVIQRRAVERWNGRLAPAIHSLSSAKRWGRTHLNEICLQAAGENILDIEELHAYYDCLGYNLDSDEQRGLELFYRCLHRIGEIGEVPGLEIYSTSEHSGGSFQPIERFNFPLNGAMLFNQTN